MAETHLPVKMYQTTHRLVVAAPMPGLEPGDILVRVTTGGALELHGKRRGPRQDEMNLLLDEWGVGPYERTLSLPCPVDGPHADVTYGNGVLVVALPKSTRMEPADLPLERVGLARGQRVGSHGKGLTPTTTEEHRQGQARAATAASD